MGSGLQPQRLVPSFKLTLLLVHIDLRNLKVLVVATLSLLVHLYFVDLFVPFFFIIVDLPLQLPYAFMCHERKKIRRIEPCCLLCAYSSFALFNYLALFAYCGSVRPIYLLAILLDSHPILAIIVTTSCPAVMRTTGSPTRNECIVSLLSLIRARCSYFCSLAAIALGDISPIPPFLLNISRYPHLGEEKTLYGRLILKQFRHSNSG